MRFLFLHPTKFLGSPLYKGKEESRMLVGSSYNILLSAPSFYKGISKDLVGSRNFYKKFRYTHLRGLFSRPLRTIQKAFENYSRRARELFSSPFREYKSTK